MRHLLQDVAQSCGCSHPFDAIAAGAVDRVPNDRVIFNANILWPRELLLRLHLDEGEEEYNYLQYNQRRLAWHSVFRESGGG